MLLINHPLDCPVCDQAGECGLQDYSYEYGQAIHRFVEERTVNPRKDVSDLIQLNADRCIMCTRCVRFTREITQTGELQVMRRGNHAEIDVFPGHPVDNPLAGNVVDLCPVGALLDKDFLHKQRVWFLSKHDARLHAAAPPAATFRPRRTVANSGGSSRATIRSSTTTGSATKADTATRPRTTPHCSRPCMSARGGDLKPAPVDQTLEAAGAWSRPDGGTGRYHRWCLITVPDGGRSLSDGVLLEAACIPRPSWRSGRCRYVARIRRSVLI